jgi:hypothetical protein
MFFVVPLALKGAARYPHGYNRCFAQWPMQQLHQQEKANSNQ